MNHWEALGRCQAWLWHHQNNLHSRYQIAVAKNWKKYYFLSENLQFGRHWGRNFIKDCGWVVGGSILELPCFSSPSKLSSFQCLIMRLFYDGTYLLLILSLPSELHFQLRKCSGPGRNCFRCCRKNLFLVYVSKLVTPSQLWREELYLQ